MLFIFLKNEHSVKKKKKKNIIESLYKQKLCPPRAHTRERPISQSRDISPFQWTTQYIKPDCISRGKWFRGDVRSRCRLSSLFFLLARSVLY